MTETQLKHKFQTFVCAIEPRRSVQLLQYQMKSHDSWWIDVRGSRKAQAAHNGLQGIYNTLRKICLTPPQMAL